MCGSSKIFLMPPMSFGVQTRVTRNVPLPRNKTLLTLPIIFLRFFVPQFPQSWCGNCPGCGGGNVPGMFLMRLWAQLGQQPRPGLCHCSPESLSCPSIPQGGTFGTFGTLGLALVSPHGTAQGSDLGNNYNSPRTAFGAVYNNTSALHVC